MCAREKKHSRDKDAPTCFETECNLSQPVPLTGSNGHVIGIREKLSANVFMKRTLKPDVKTE